MTVMLCFAVGFAAAGHNALCPKNWKVLVLGCEPRLQFEQYAMGFGVALIPIWLWDGLRFVGSYWHSARASKVSIARGVARREWIACRGRMDRMTDAAV